MQRSVQLIACFLAALCAGAFDASAQREEQSLVSIESQATAIFEKSRDAVVRICARSNVKNSQIRRRPDLPPNRIGSGFLIDKKGWVATTASNVDDADEVTAEWKGKQYRCIPLGIDLYTNLALLRIEANLENGFPKLPLGDSDTVKGAAFVMALGFPFDQKVAPSWGSVASVDARRGGVLFPVAHIRSNVKVVPGQGGGPLLNSKGEVVGMIVAATHGDDATYSLPVNALKKLKEDFVTDGRARYGWSGLSAKDQDVPMNPRGAILRRPVISAIAPDSPAATSELKIGDVVLELDGHDLKESTDIPGVVFFKRDGDTLTMKVLREGQVRLMVLKLAERPKDFVPNQRPDLRAPLPTTPAAPQMLPASAPKPK